MCVCACVQALVIVVLVVYRFVLRGPRLMFGNLPGRSDTHKQASQEADDAM